MVPASAMPQPEEDLDCFEFHAHGMQAVGDTSPFQVPSGENYRCFYFASPWKQDAQGIRVDWSQNAVRVVHHSLLYSVTDPHTPGSIEDCDGIHLDGTLMPAFGLDKLPADVGFKIPSGSGQSFLLEIHYINTGDPVEDTTGLRLCAARTPRPNTATLTWLGTEDIGGLRGMPPGRRTTVTGSCDPGRKGLAAGDDIHLLMLAPHMHQLGISSQTILHRKGGTTELLLEAPYSYGSPESFRLDVSMHQGDTLETHCTYDNTTDAYVGFGPTISDEMCYILGLAYPAGALDNDNPTLVGATNTCL
jgi:hypothetical protein